MRIKFNRDISIQCEAGQTVDIPEIMASYMIAQGYAEVAAPFLDLSQRLTPESYIDAALELRDVANHPAMQVEQ